MSSGLPATATARPVGVRPTDAAKPAQRASVYVPTPQDLERLEGELTSPQVAKFMGLAKSVGSSLGLSPTSAHTADATSALLVGVDPELNPLRGSIVGDAVDLTNATMSGALKSLASGAGAGSVIDSISEVLDPRDGSPSLFRKNDAILGGVADRLRARLMTSSDPATIAMLISVDTLRAQNRREEEKLELLKAIMFSLMIGQVPVALINRARELGMGHIIKEVVSMMVNNGELLTAGNVRALQELGLPCIQPEHTDDSLKKAKSDKAAITFRLPEGAVVNAFGQQVPGQVADRWAQGAGR